MFPRETPHLVWLEKEIESVSGHSYGTFPKGTSLYFEINFSVVKQLGDVPQRDTLSLILAKRDRVSLWGTSPYYYIAIFLI
jgi:hypothetical protein